MTLHRLRPVGERLLSPLIPSVRRAGVTPDLVSALALFGAVGGAVAFARASYVIGVVLVAVSGWLDLLDGMLAREQGIEGPAGFLLDQTVDRYADLLVVIGLTVGVGRYPLGLAAVTGVFMTSFVGLGAKTVDIDHLLTGGFCRADRLSLVAVAGIITAVKDVNAIPALLIVMALAGHLTAGVRLYRIRRALACLHQGTSDR